MCSFLETLSVRRVDNGKIALKLKKKKQVGTNLNISSVHKFQKQKLGK